MKSSSENTHPQLKIWSIEVDAENPFDLTVQGTGINVEETSGSKEVYLGLPTQRHLLIRTNQDGLQLFVPGGNVYPIYARTAKGKLFLSNISSKLMFSGEVIELDTFVLLQNLTGIPYPQNNILKNISLLQASGNYFFKNGALERKSSLLEGGPKTSI
ncbi:MAG: hypothetical protein PHX43_09595, partial [Alphaproteobacteria bacterium]|nr:hypothetical protein [Alphaproteobacteria bacterium]